ncbi:MAG: hypothetical protein CML68_17100 [Rhodobacteraceae bacterium]|nr:hypothetical protein [Paracoccaceae bacterium]
MQPAPDYGPGYGPSKNDLDDFIDFLEDLVEIIEEIAEWLEDWDGPGGFTYTPGTSLDDTIAANDASQVITAFSGNDIIETGAGTDFVFAGVGNDTIILGSGTNYVRGGLDSDTFVFTEGASGTTFIRDLIPGQDVIDVSALGVTGFEDMVVRSYGYGTILYVDDLTIHVEMPLGALSESDFIFA